MTPTKGKIMRIQLVYPSWPKLEKQTEFHLPPHGPVVFAASLPQDIEVNFIDENVQEFTFDTDADLICMSVMLTCQLPRAFEIADQYRKLGQTVMFGGIAVMLHAEEVMEHGDCVFLGEAEGRMEKVIQDFQANKLAPVYDYMNNFPDITAVGTFHDLEKQLPHLGLLPAGKSWTETATTTGEPRCWTWCTPPGDASSTAFPAATDTWEDEISDPDRLNKSSKRWRPFPTTAFLWWTIPWPMTRSGWLNYSQP